MLFAALLGLLTLAGCTTIRPAIRAGAVAPPPPQLHRDFERVLERFVDDLGNVDYAGLKRDPGDLERYYALLVNYSPDTHPALFPTEDAKLAYWINAYNATVLKTVIEHYPIGSIADVKPPPPVSFLVPDRAGFFFFQRVTFGGKTTSLHYLENSVIRQRFSEPRAHFALNCASRGCPRLPREAFDPERLDQQLDREARRFLSEARNFRIEPAEKIVYLSSIFDWYGDDFRTWLARHGGGGTVLDYIALYVPSERVEELRSARSYALRFLPYDWALNDTGRTEARGR